jgi:hypothetical protein
LRPLASVNFLKFFRTSWLISGSLPVREARGDRSVGNRPGSCWFIHPSLEDLLRQGGAWRPGAKRRAWLEKEDPVPLEADLGDMAGTLPSAHLYLSLGKKEVAGPTPAWRNHTFLRLRVPYSPTALCVCLPGPGNSSGGPGLYLQAGRALTPMSAQRWTLHAGFCSHSCPTSLLGTPQEWCLGMSL